MKIKMRFQKFLVFCVSALLAFTFCACSSTAPLPPNNGNNDSKTDPADPVNPDDPVDENTFTVRLVGDGFIIPAEELASFSDSGLRAVWTDISSVNGASRSAEFDLNGCARLSDLDGDYRITLSGTLNNYTYNPNIYTANNDRKTVEIKLYQLTTLEGLGSGSSFNKNDVIKLSASGFYRAVLTEVNYSDGVRFWFVPNSETGDYVGEYSLESFVNVTANNVNPILQIYNGNYAAGTVWSPSTVESGGKSGTFTKNFRYELEAKEHSDVPFLIKAAKTEEAQFPIYVDFLLDKDGEHSGGNNKKEMIPTHDFEAARADIQNDTRDKTFTFVSNSDQYSSCNYYSMNYIILGTDGYYHLKTSTGEGARLYAKITQDPVGITTDSHGGFLDGKFGGQLALNGKSYKYFIKGKSYEDSDGTLQYEYKGYANYVNGDGVYPVTEELKEFLQAFSEARGYFQDGDGYLEGLGYNSSDKAQWLFACGYYR